MLNRVVLTGRLVADAVVVTVYGPSSVTTTYLTPRDFSLAAAQAWENRVHTERMAPLPEGSTVGEVEAS